MPSVDIPEPVVNPPLTGEEWRREFEALRQEIRTRASRYPVGHVLDDSRDTLYSEREDSQL